MHFRLGEDCFSFPNKKESERVAKKNENVLIVELLNAHDASTVSDVTGAGLIMKTLKYR